MKGRTFIVVAIASVCAMAASLDDDYARLRAMQLILPINGLKTSDIHDSFSDRRSSGKPHGAIDLPAARGTEVHAMTDGVIRKLFFSKAGGNTIYEYDPAQVYCFYYAHLDRYAAGIAEGKHVRRGEVIGYVGSTGDASPLAPHLHLEITRLDAAKHWWPPGPEINPYPLIREMASR